MKLVVAEKPSVARDIAAVIGADEVIDGVLTGNGYMVTSARGHLVRLKMPEEYDERFKTRSLSALPIIPDFEFVPIEGAEDVLRRLDSLMNSPVVDEIIEATDAGREGECIFRYIYNYIGCTKPVKRLWISSLTAESIRQGFNNLLDYSDKDSAFDAGLARNKVDWLWGMNLSRLYSFYCKANCSIGRVQTATVNMIVQREREIAAFVKKPFYKLKLENGAEWFDGDEDSFPDKSAAETVKAKCENSPKSCYFRLWNDDLFWTGKGKKLTSTLMKSLLTKGKVKVSGLKSKEKEKTYDAIISFSDKTYTDKNGKLHVGFAMEFENSKKQKKGGK